MKIYDVKKPGAIDIVAGVMEYYGFPFHGFYNGYYIWEKREGHYPKMGEDNTNCDYRWVKVWVHPRTPEELKKKEPVLEIFAGYNSVFHNAVCDSFRAFDTEEIGRLIRKHPWIGKIPMEER